MIVRPRTSTRTMRKIGRSGFFFTAVWRASPITFARFRRARRESRAGRSPRVFPSALIESRAGGDMPDRIGFYVLPKGASAGARGQKAGEMTFANAKDRDAFVRGV